MLRTHGRYAYSNITKRPDYSWPDGKRLAVYMAVNAVTHAWRRNPRTQHHQLRGAGHLDEAAEAELIRTVTETIERHEGQRPVGWMSQWLSNSGVTPDLLQEAGYRHVAVTPSIPAPLPPR